jgi:hypothetical protein
MALSTIHRRYIIRPEEDSLIDRRELAALNVLELKLLITEIDHDRQFSTP